MAPTSHRSWQATLLLCTAAVGLWFTPPSLTERLKNAVRDAVRPGRLAILSATDVVDSLIQELAGAEEQARRIAALEARLAEWQQRFRNAQVERAKESEQARLLEHSGLTGTTTEPLLIPELVSARILNEWAAALWRSGQLLSVGTDAALQESSWVLSDASRPLLDQGELTGLETEQPVLAGRCVVGKIDRVGRWTSTFVPITDARFRGGARLVRETPDGPVFGATGVLCGDDGPLCRLERIPATATVAVGDSVYTGGSDDLLPVPMYYGEVVKAELPDGAGDWILQVEPAVDPRRVDHVQVVRISVNPVRLREAQRPTGGPQ